MVQILTRSGAPEPFKVASRPNSSSRWFDTAGNINASSKKDLVASIASIMSASTSGQAVWSDPEASAETAADRKERIELARHAFHDRTGSTWQETGANISATLYETAKREGFMRRFLVEGDLMNGTMPRLNVRYQNVQAIVATGPTVLVPQLAKQRYLYPPEFYVLGNVRVEDKDIAQGATDILEDAYNRALEQINVQEDRTLINMFDASIGTNPLFMLTGGATPSNLAAMRTAVLQWGLQAEQWLIAADYWTDVAGNAAAFGNLFDPVTRYELVQTGFLGTLFGMAITTDGFRDPMQQVLAPNTCYILTAPVNLGAYTDRGPVKAVEQNNYNDGIPARGWWFSELISNAITNTRGIVKGVRA
jgi:hypothetical protein